MIIDYSDNEIERICNDNQYALRKFKPSVVKSLQKLLYLLSSNTKFTLFRYSPIGKKYDIHEMNKSKKISDGTISIGIDDKVRMTVKVEYIREEDKITILKVTTHYGD